MIKGMTGFGYAEVSSGNTVGAIEIKSVNHRYLDINYYLPIGFASIESRARDFLQKYLERGRVTVSLKIISKPLQHVAFNKALVKEYLKYAHRLKKELGLKGELSVSELIHLPGVIETKETELDAESLWPTIEKGMRVALEELVSMRQKEGRSLARDISDKLQRMLLQVKKIRNRSRHIFVAKKKILTEEEFVSFQKNADINEEISRLLHYIEQFKSLLAVRAAVGKRLDFIAQEMQRETNTIGSKLQDKIVSNAVIALKAKIENLREQAQNIE